MRAILVDLARLILLILLLPLAVIFIGPLLVLAVFRGQQQMGPITFDSARYDFAGRAGILMLGLAIWLLIWSGLAWLTLEATSSSPVLVQIRSTPPAVATPVVNEPTSAAALSTATPTVNLSTPTPVLSTPTPTAPTQTPTAESATSTATNVSPLTPTFSPRLTPTLLLGTPTRLPGVTPTATPGPLSVEATATSSPAPQTPLAPADRLAAVAAIEEANALLQAAITLPNEENLAQLALIWQDRALIKVENFAVEQYEKYIRPFEVQFEYITRPVISEQVSASQLIITTQERWSYGGTSEADQEAFEFIYTLERKNERWVITRYTYKNLPLPTPTTISREQTTPATSTPPQN